MVQIWSNEINNKKSFATNLILADLTTVFKNIDYKHNSTQRTIIHRKTSL